MNEMVASLSSAIDSSSRGLGVKTIFSLVSCSTSIRGSIIMPDIVSVSG